MDSTWTKEDLKSIPNKNYLRRSLDLDHRDKNTSLKKVSSIENKSRSNRNELGEKSNSFKKKYRDYQKELSIA